MKRVLSVWFVTLVFSGVFPAIALAEDSVIVQTNTSAVTNLSATRPSEPRLHMQQYTEYMTPAILGNGIAVPNQDGHQLTGTFADGRLWADYEIGSNWKLLYWQRYIVAPTAGFLFYDPRIGFRKTQVFNVPGLTTVYDFFFLPGISNFATNASRLWTLGSRTNTTYEIPKSWWAIGLVTETMYSIYKGGTSRPSDFYGLLVPYASYTLSSVLSTQHWFVFPFKHAQSESWSQFSWDLTGAPFVQNGIGINAHNNVWVGVFVNNYLTAAPRLENTWASLWLNFKFI